MTGLGLKVTVRAFLGLFCSGVRRRGVFSLASAFEIEMPGGLGRDDMVAQINPDERLEVWL